jgi:proteasome assembly chaperone (PAC2) family protein
MADKPQLHRPWLVAVWPGMGNVALNAGVYLMAKLDMKTIGELDTGELFDVDYVEVKSGIVQPGRRPRNQLFFWNDPHHKHDLVVFLGETQPPVGKFHFCRQLLAYAQELGVERLFTFAAMATQMHPEQRSRVFAAATDEEMLTQLHRLELETLEDGNIGGLNGVLLGVAQGSLRGACLLGEMPHIFSQLPFPKASLAILEAFTALAGIELDFTELAEQARATDQQLGQLLARLEKTYGRAEAGPEEDSSPESTEEQPRLGAADRKHIEALFAEAGKNRSKAFELKQELDRLNVFKDYEDRFLDLFRNPG